MDFNFDFQFNRNVIGVDEVGRGSWAGPVIAGAAFLNYQMPIDKRLNDSKKLTPKIRKEILENLTENNIFGIGHHMGTTRMGFSKEDSVCDLNLKYHGINNLYINSTSVFPTGGIANPTLTLLALTSRLAENLNND